MEPHGNIARASQSMAFHMHRKLSSRRGLEPLGRRWSPWRPPFVGGLPAGLVLVSLLLLVSACGDGEEGSGGGGPGAMKKGMGGKGSTVVRVASVELGEIDARSSYVAETRPRADVRLAAEVSGVVEEVHVDLGDRVEKGQLLARVRGRTFGQAVREAEASVAHAEAAVLRAEVELELAKKERDRARQLHSRGALTRSELESIEGRYASADAALQLARADSKQRSARLERARIDLANTRIVAPFSGFIAEKMVDPGALLSPGAHLFRIVDSDSIVVRFAAPEADIVRLRVGQELEVSFEAGGVGSHHGRVERISPIVDPGTRTTPVETTLEAGERLRPGMFARVTATLASRSEVPLIPVAAVVRRQLSGESEAREGVFVVRDGQAHFEPVEVGLRSQEKVEALDGLEEGDEIVVAGHSDLRHGAAVRLVGDERQGGLGEQKAGKGRKAR